MENAWFIKQYDWRILAGLPVNVEIYQFPGGMRDYSEEYVVEVLPYNGKPWIGNFHGIDKSYLSDIFSTPNDVEICVVANGRGYIANVNEPSKVEVIRSCPIIEVRYTTK